MTAIDVMGLLLAQTDPQQQGSTWWDTIQSGGVVGYIIIGLSVLALAVIIMLLVQIRRAALIPPDQLERIFGIGFSRTGPRVEIEFGWFTAHTIIQEHQGKIETESEVGKGTEVTIYLPMRD